MNLIAFAFVGLVACGGGEPAPAEAPPAPAQEQAAPSDAPAAAADAADGTPIRIGWQETWATQGQLAVILKQSKILNELGFAPTFVGFSYGAPLNEGALAGEVDVLFTADQPAIALCNRDNTWGMIGRLMYNRVGTFVPPDSAVQTVADLKGKTIAIPFGAAAHRETLGAVKAAGMDPSTDINAVNMGIKEVAVLAKTNKWETVHAGSAWDPVFAQLESSGTVRTVAQGLVTSVVVMDDDFVKANPGADKKFMEGMVKAYEQYKGDTAKANADFKTASNLDFSLAALDLAASVEPNLGADNAITVTLSDDDKANIQKAADFMFDAKILKAKVDTSTMIRDATQ
ncbi:MAG: ABC transporter substrate-binding protein [Myxococcota bacterium]|nr:ABC transporter substrate-binding protein [Myxococcota bacterium]MEC9388632.1 ABC transporter substrate-binding protein [Myxococcota bacterium]